MGVKLGGAVPFILSRQVTGRTGARAFNRIGLRWIMIQHSRSAAEKRNSVKKPAKKGEPMATPSPRVFLERGTHAFVFLSLVFGVTITKIVEAWTDLAGGGDWPSVLVEPRTLMLASISILTIQYWWVLFDTTEAYGQRFYYFLLALGQSAFFYAVAILLGPHPGTDGDRQITFAFFWLGLLILVLMLDDHKKDDRMRRHVFRLMGLIACAAGFFREDAHVVAAGTVLVLAILYTIARVTGKLGQTT
jgi:hypothetical protein